MKPLLYLLAFSFSFYITKAQGDYNPVELSENLYVIVNPEGGNIAFLVTRKGVLVVDAGSSPINGEKIISAIRTVTIKPLTHLILTHMHGDHIYGISGFPEDIKILSHINLEKNNAELNDKNLTNYKENIFPVYLANLKLQLDSVSDKESEEYAALMESYNSNVDYFENIKNIKFRKPDITFEDYYLLKLADQRIMLEYTGPGHTNDNIVVKFSNHNVIHTGDLVFNGSFPYLIVEHGVDVYNWIRTLDDLYKENIYTVIPGHGEIGRKIALKDQSDYFRKLSHEIEALKNAGYTLGEIKEKIDLNDYDLKGNEDQFPVNIEVIYTELVNKGRGWWEF
jgi:glyoxylase-like metal-dependent hydrolase (beta-lactamase superfamily II)